MWLRGVPWLIHYLDDFLLFGPPRSTDCNKSLELACSTCSELGFTAHKIEGPASSITFLGIEIDSIAAQLRLPQDKLTQLTSELKQWHNHRSCTKRQLLSLIGSLSHASKVVRPGRTFLRRLIDLSTTVSELHHHI